MHYYIAFVAHSARTAYIIYAGTSRSTIPIPAFNQAKPCTPDFSSEVATPLLECSTDKGSRTTTHHLSYLDVQKLSKNISSPPSQPYYTIAHHHAISTELIYQQPHQRSIHSRDRTHWPICRWHRSCSEQYHGFEPQLIEPPLSARHFCEWGHKLRCHFTFESVTRCNSVECRSHRLSQAGFVVTAGAPRARSGEGWQLSGSHWRCQCRFHSKSRFSRSERIS